MNLDKFTRIITPKDLEEIDPLIRLGGDETTKPLDFANSILGNWLVKRRWWILSLIAAGLFYLELWEDSFKPLNSVHLAEYLLYVFFLALIGILITLLMSLMKDQVRNLQILDHKHRIDLEIITNGDWQVLAQQLVKIPGQIAPVAVASLFVRNPILGHFELAALNVTDDSSGAESGLKKMCPVCQAALEADGRKLKACPENECEGSAGPRSASYCLAVRDCEKIHAIIYFRMAPGQQLNAEQSLILETLDEDILVALKAGQDRKMLAEMSEAEASLSERRKVSHFLHDSLGQNLSFINLKVSQLIAEKQQLHLEGVQNDLEQVREAAGLSHDIVRGILEVNQATTMPLLSNLLFQHATKVSQRANFAIEFDVEGEPGVVSTEVQRTVFYVFQEALSNIEKHAGASNVKVDLHWCADELQIRILDDGQGFQPEQVGPGRHYGLSIMQERINRVGGMIEVSSAIQQGTRVEICVPISLHNPSYILPN